VKSPFLPRQKRIGRGRSPREKGTEMTSLWTKYALALLAAVACLPNLAVSQDAEPGGMTPEQIEGMKKWQEACTPGPYHERMAKSIGKYFTETTCSPSPSTR
jgi:hypothetical protein